MRLTKSFGSGQRRSPRRASTCAKRAPSITGARPRRTVSTSGSSGMDYSPGSRGAPSGRRGARLRAPAASPWSGAAGRGEAAKLAARRQHAVARDDDRHRIAAHRFADLARALPIGRTELARQLAIGRGVAPGERAHRLVERPAERIEAGEIDRDRGEVDRLAREIAPDVGDQRRDPRRRLGGAGACGSRGEPPLGRGAARSPAAARRPARAHSTRRRTARSPCRRRGGGRADRSVCMTPIMWCARRANPPGFCRDRADMASPPGPRYGPAK